jgi:hypothetical protein
MRHTMTMTLDWLDISQGAGDDTRASLDIAASVALAHRPQVEGDVQTLLSWLHSHGGAPDDTGEGLGRWAVDDQRGERDGRFEVAITLALDEALLQELQDLQLLSGDD